MKVQITMACGDYAHTLPLRTGAVAADGIDLNYIVVGSHELFRRQANYAEFDASEFSLSTLMILHSRGDTRFVGIPVFPVKRFRHKNIFINIHSNIKQPQDLVGKRVGVLEFLQTAGVWMRGFLHHDYGVKTDSINWYLGGFDEPEESYSERIDLSLPKNIRRIVIPPDKSLDQMLERGEIDAVMSPSPPKSFILGSSNVVRLFPDFKDAEIAYFKRTRIFPIMHTLVLKRAVYERYPWTAQSLFKAFVQAKAMVMQRLASPVGMREYYPLPWLPEYVQEIQSLLGRDFWSYGLRENLHTLETLAQYAFEQGLLDRRIERVDDLFAIETHKGVEFGRI
ncbi:MAG TPA: ABC transporter substrate-binding protein [Candidatus Eisenbacteria bacterium]|nr:ABC transporter substrate-binding protein [Candidatus Eisenbacteria bacterium]